MGAKDSVSLIIPTLNEAENIRALLVESLRVLEDSGVDYEILVVDDPSTDHTPELAQAALGEKGRVIRRAQERSLSLSVLDGISQARGSILMVMDADGSHPPEVIGELLSHIRGGFDLVIGSRYVTGGGTRNFSILRKIASRLACLLGSLVCKVKDNTSGFFAIRRSALDGVRLTPQGFKIGLEIFVKAKFNRFKEVPYVFINRRKGKSKFNLKPALQYLKQVGSLFIYRFRHAAD